MRAGSRRVALVLCAGEGVGGARRVRRLEAVDGARGARAGTGLGDVASARRGRPAFGAGRLPPAVLVAAGPERPVGGALVTLVARVEGAVAADREQDVARGARSWEIEHLAHDLAGVVDRFGVVDAVSGWQEGWGELVGDTARTDEAMPDVQEVAGVRRADDVTCGVDRDRDVAREAGQTG